MRELKIGRNEEGQRLNKYLLKYLNSATSSFIYKMLRKKNIVLNDKKAKGDEILKSGDFIKLYLAEETIDKFHTEKIKADINSKQSIQYNNLNKIDKYNINNVKILYADNDILALHKPAGMLSQKANASDYSVNEYVIEKCIQDGILSVEDMVTFKPSIANRLDRNTSGIILAGISLKGSQFLGRVLKDRTIEKYYYTIVKGVLNKQIRCKGYLHKDYPENKSKVIDIAGYNNLSENNKKEYSEIDTEFIPISFNKEYSLLKVKIYTGKTHQIRAHLRHLGYFVLGDKKYGELNVNKYFEKKYGLKHHLLHSGLLILEAQNTDDMKSHKRIIVKDELPEIFIDICKGENLPWEPGILED